MLSLQRWMYIDSSPYEMPKQCFVISQVRGMHVVAATLDVY